MVVPPTHSTGADGCAVVTATQRGSARPCGQLAAFGHQRKQRAARLQPATRRPLLRRSTRRSRHAHSVITAAPQSAQAMRQPPTPATATATATRAPPTAPPPPSCASFLRPTSIQKAPNTPPRALAVSRPSRHAQPNLRRLRPFQLQPSHRHRHPTRSTSTCSPLHTTRRAQHDSLLGRVRHPLALPLRLALHCAPVQLHSQPRQATTITVTVSTHQQY